MSFSPETNTTRKEIIYADNGHIEVNIPDAEPIGVLEHDPFKLAAKNSAALRQAAETRTSDEEDPLKYDPWEARRRNEAILGRVALNS